MSVSALFPAHAGMDLSSRRRRPSRSRPVPRTRGDGPAIVVSLLTAVVTVPRTRGDGPALPTAACSRRLPCSPHTRGWTGLAAPARSTVCSVPRTRGDGPAVSLLGIYQWQDCSPHTRGWTGLGCPPALGTDLFPAHAGMDRSCARDARG